MKTLLLATVAIRTLGVGAARAGNSAGDKASRHAVPVTCHLRVNAGPGIERARPGPTRRTRPCAPNARRGKNPAPVSITRIG